MSRIFDLNLGLFGIGTFSQVNGISSAVNGFFDADNSHCVNIPFLGEYSWSVVIASLVLAVCVALVLIGGVKRIASVSQVIVPFMAVLYVLFVGVLVITNITKVPTAFKIIVEAAFSPRAITGGVVGSMLVAMQKGVARGIFSNEAGLGSAPIAAAAAQTKEPVRQGLVSMTGTFIDTIVICTLTGLSIVITGAWQVEGLQGVQVTTYAFQNGLPFPAQVSSFVLMLCLVFLPFTHIFERAWSYLCLSEGAELIINTYPHEIQESMREVHPTCMCSVPRFWEKVYIAVKAKMDDAGPLQKKLFYHALAVGKKRNIEYIANCKRPPLALELEYRIINKTVLSMVRKQLGLEKPNIFPTAGAYVSPEVEEFVHAIGINWRWVWLAG